MARGRPKKDESDVLADNNGNRKSVIREALLKVMKDKRLFKGGVFEEERCFDMNMIVDPRGSKGLLRDCLPDFNAGEKRIFRDILQDLKNEKVLFHKTGAQWAWERTK